MTAFFVLGTALSAYLLFSIQFLMAGLYLPEFGGSPALWLSSIVFFQGLLCLSYSYSHGLRKFFSIKTQLLIHGSLLLLCLGALSLLHQPEILWPRSETVIEDPALRIVLLLFSRCGLLFFALGASSGLLQHWRSQVLEEDPYWLYSASNGGSVLGVVLDAVLLGRFLSLDQRLYLWSAAFILCALSLVGIMLWVAVRDKAKQEAAMEEGEERESIPWKQRIRWFLWAAVPSFLLYGLTTQLTTDLASVPLLWTLPLLLYLLSYILAFSKFDWGWLERPLRSLLPVGLVFVLVMALPNLPLPRTHLAVLLTLEGLLVAAAMALIHKDLTYDRPDAGSLTDFYLMIAFGGFFGGLLCSLWAPLLFPNFLEYPLGLVLTILFLWNSETQGAWKSRVQLMVLSMILGLLLFCWNSEVFVSNLVFLVLGIGLLGVARWSADFLSKGSVFFSMLLILGITAFAPGPMAGIQESHRSFFGLHRIVLEKDSETLVLLHGKTVHGRQSLNPESRGEALAYYHKSGPAGQVFRALKDREKIAVFGLGVGSLAAYSERHQRWTFFEIDPEVVMIAQDKRRFHFLEDAKGTIEVKLGDARLELAALPKDQTFDILTLDVFSSGSIPTHLLTREAFEIYLQRLSKKGVLLLHISNQHLDLEALVASQARALGLTMLAQRETTLSESDLKRGCTRSHWALLAREEKDLAIFQNDKRWREVSGDGALAPWTDNHSDLLSIYRFGR